VRRFADQEIFVEIQENVRGEDVFVVQSTSYPANDNLMELLIIIDALRRASARRITAVIPYFGYARQDRKSLARTPISAKLVANMITTAGADRVLTVDLHAGQIQGFFDIPVDEMSAMFLIAQYFVEKQLQNPVVVSPDLGNTKRSRNFAEILDAPLAIIEKRRMGNSDKSEVLNLIGSVRGAEVVIVDDEIDTAGSITQAAQVCMDHGATAVYATCVHPVLSGPAIQRLRGSLIKEIVVTDTIGIPPDKRIDKITVLTVAPLLGETIQRIHTGASVGAAYKAARGAMTLRMPI
jgi:ribose-phosphate pyrophosphokinase